MLRIAKLTDYATGLMIQMAHAPDRRPRRAALRRFRAGDAALVATLWRPLIESAWRRYFVDRVRDMPKQSVFAAA